MSYKFYIGVDVSKYTLDFTLLAEGNFLLHETVGNSKRDIGNWLKQIMASHKAGGKKTLFCVENTGSYHAILVNELIKRKVPLWLEAALQIHLSLGMHRGKSDKLDSQRIAEYAYTHRNKARLWQQPREVIEQLKQLRSLRERLVRVKKQLKHEPKELKQFYRKAVHDVVSTHCEESLKAIKKDFEKVNQTIIAVIMADKRLSQLYQWLTSITGIGQVLATEMIITTNEFKNFSSPKKFACYCGVAPFRYTSGVSTQSKAKVSKRANQRMKRLLHLAAVSSIRYDGDCKQYYDRRVKLGVHKTSILNVIRNKFIHRAFAVVREERFYEK